MCFALDRQLVIVVSNCRGGPGGRPGATTRAARTSLSHTHLRWDSESSSLEVEKSRSREVKMSRVECQNKADTSSLGALANSWGLDYSTLKIDGTNRECL